MSPSGGVEGSRWFEQMASTLNQPPKPGFQDPAVKTPFQAQQPDMGQPQQPAQNPGFPPKEPSLFDILFGPAFSEPDFASQPQGVQSQNQQPSNFGSQPAQGFETKEPGLKPESQGGFGFQNADFQTQPVQPQQQPPDVKGGCQQPNVDPGFQPQQNQNPRFQGQQAGFAGQPNPAFNDPMQSEMSIFNNILRNFFMW